MDKLSLTIAVTGGAGYKGTLLVQALLDAGHRVTLVDNFMCGLEPALFFGAHPHCTVIRKDVRNLTRGDVAGFDCIYHLAAVSGYPACEANPHAAKVINVDATQRLVEILSDDQTLIYASTTSIYGDAGREVDETFVPQPTSLYGVTKLEAERVCMSRRNSISFRFATLFGVSLKMRCDLLVNDFTYKAVTEKNLVLYGEESIRSFLHVRDAVRAYLAVLVQRDQMVGQVYNVGSNSMNHSKIQIAELINEHTEVDVIRSQMTDADPRNFLVNFDKLTALGFEATIGLSQGVQELINLYRWYQPNRPFVTI